MDLKIIAHIDTDLDEKFGIPRQSGLVPSLQGRIVFEPGYRDPNALRGLEGYDYIWLIWHFSEGSASAKPAEGAAPAEDAVADIPDMPADAPAPAPVAAPAPSAGDVAGVPGGLLIFDFILQFAACLAIGFLGYLLYTDLNTAWF